MYKTVKILLEKLSISNLSERYVLITGCDTGFGNLLAKKLDHLGLRVFACCLTKDGVEELHNQCSSKLVAIEMDVRKEESIRNCLRIVRQRLGDQGLWGLVNNAGVSGPNASFEMIKQSQIEQCLDVNIFGMIRVTKAFLPLVRKTRGRIINAASVVGRFALLFLPYSVSKFAVEGFSDKLRRELYHTGVTVHIVEPGAFKTSLMTLEAVARDSRTMFEEADEEIKEYYGKEFVDENLEVMKTSYDTFMSSALWKVVDAYTHALIAQYPRYRYQVGWDSWLYGNVIANFPEYIQDFLASKTAPAVPVACR